MSDFDLVGTLRIEDGANDVLEKFKGMLEESGGAAASMAMEVMGLVGVIAALGFSLKEVIDAASEMEDTMTRMNVLAANIGESTDSVVGANEDAIAMMTSVTDTFQAHLSDVAEQTQQKMSDLSERMVAANEAYTKNVSDRAEAYLQQWADMEESHANRVQSIRDSMASVQQDFADSQQERQSNLADTEDDIHQKAADKREDLERKLASTHSSREAARLKLEIDAVNRTEAEQIKKAQEKEAKEEAKAKKAEEKRLAQLQKQLDQENAAFEKSEARATRKYDKEVTDAEAAHARELASYEKMAAKIEADDAKARAKAEAEYTKQLDVLKAKFGEVALGLAPPVIKQVLHMTTEELVKLAEQQAKLTAYSKDEILQLELVAMRYTNIGKDAIPGVITASEDLAATTGQSLTTAGTMILRAMDNPQMAAGLLRRAKISLTEEEKKALAEANKHNDVLKAQEVIMSAVHRSTKGMAEAMGNTLSGEEKKVANELHELAEQMGHALLPTLREATAWLVKFLANPETQKGLQAIGDGLRDFFLWMQSLAPTIKEGQDNVTVLTKKFEELWAQLGPPLERLAKMVDAWLKAISKFWDEHGAEIMSTVGALWQFLQDIFQEGADIVGGILNILVDLLSGDWDQLGVDLKNTADALWKDIQKIWDDGMKQVLIWVGGFIVDIYNKFAGWVNNMMVAGANILIGFWNGLISKADEIHRWVDGFIKGITDKFTIKLDMHSPSGVFEGYGMNIVAGLVQGLTKGAPAASAAAGVVTSAVTNATSFQNVNNMNLTINRAQGSNTSLAHEVLLARSLSGV